ncbi:hypothetical protein JT358_03160 [Micrococcales bacterium 31B]|nr:hypothetical protein [Micrococcales bacterium 31B]
MTLRFIRFTRRSLVRHTLAALAAGAVAGHATTRAGAAHATTRAGAAHAATRAGAAHATTRASAHNTPPTVYSVPYDDDLFVQHATGARRLTIDEWRALGFPTPVPAPTEYVRLSWSRVVYAIHPWGPDRENWGHYLMSEADLRRVGDPAVRVSPWVPTVDTFTFATSDEVFASVGYDSTLHKLTLGEWLDLGAPEPSRYPDQFLKLPWLDTIFRVQPDGTGSALTLEAWGFYAFPTPMTVPRFPGDTWSRAENGTDIVYSNRDLDYARAVTPEEYARAGYPPLGADRG